MAITRAQIFTVTTKSDGAGSTVSNILASIPTAGNLLVLCLSNGDGGGAVSISSVADNIGDSGSWTAATINPQGLTVASNTQYRMYYKVVGTPAGGNKTITVTIAGTQALQLFVAEYGSNSGPVTWSVTGSQITARAATGLASAGSITTAIADAVLVGFLGHNDAPGSAGTGFTRQATSGNWAQDAVEDRLVTSAGTYAVDWGTNGAGDSGVWVAMGMAFGATAASGGPTVTTVSSNNAPEGSAIVHTVTLSGSTSGTTNYAATLVGVTATGGGVDFTSDLGVATYSNGVTFSGGNMVVPTAVSSWTVSIPTTTDAVNEGNETYTLTVGGVSGTGTISIPGIINWKSGNTVNLRASLTETLSNTKRGRWLFGLDSFVSGLGSGGTANGNCLPGSFPLQLAALLSARGYSINKNYACGIGEVNNITTAAVTQFDPRIAFSANTAILTGYPALGGLMWQLANAGTPQIDVTFGVAFDTIDILYPINPGQASITLSADGGGVQQTINEAGTAALGYQSLSVTGTSVVNIKRSTAGFAYTSMVGVRNSATKSIELINAGCGSLRVQTAATASTGVNTWNFLAAVPQVLESGTNNVLWLNGWYNDRSAGRTTAQAQADLATLIVAGKARGDVVYVNYAPLDTATISKSEQDIWSQAMIATALSYDIPIVDMSQVMPPYVAGPLYFNNLHLSGAGQAVVASKLLDALTSIDAGGPVVSSITTTSPTEAGSIVFTVTMSGTGGGTYTYSWGGTATSADYTQALTTGMCSVTAGSGTVTVSGSNITVPSTATAFTITVPTTTDTLDETNETVILTLGGTVSSTSTINDDDPLPSVSVADATQSGGTVTFVVTLSAASGRSVTVDYDTASGTQTEGVAFTNATGTLTFAPGETTKNVVVTIL